MKNFFDHIKIFFCFPIYIRKNYLLNLKMKRKISSLKDELGYNIAYTDTVISSFLSNDYGLNENKREHEITVSLTSHSYRVEKVHLTIQSLMDQDFKADIIVLYLNKEYFNESNIPQCLKMLENRGLIINFCKDVGPHTKLLPALKQYTNNLLVTVDDDIIYPRSLLRKLYEAYIKDPQFIHCHRMHYMKFDANGKVKPYRKWDHCSDITEAGFFVFPTGVGGVLYPPHSLDEEVFNEKAFLGLSPNADDVWFKAMSLLNGVQCKKVDSNIMNSLVVVRGTQDIGLMHENVFNNANDVKIDKVFTAYNLWRKFI